MLLTWNVESWGEDEDGEEITKVSQQGIVVPDCCKAAQTHPLIILRYAGMSGAGAVRAWPLPQLGRR